ncbi:MAG: enoyl-CoA hydratase-related protein [Sedimenticola sp.]|nr:enoyl-CoA hydratase-related protein [Sedimenticola sp.]
MMSYENILLDQVEPGIFLLTINRPRSFNSLNSATLDEIYTAGEALASSADARVLLITGAGEKAFVAGADIPEMKEKTALEGQVFSQKGMRAFRRLETLAIPVIAVVNGYCLGGGCELAMSCDWIIASDKAQFGQPEVNLGVTPGFGASQRLPRLIGRAKAMELLTTGRQIKADEAGEWGLVNHIYPAAELMEKALETARTICEKGPVAVNLVKQAVQRGQDLDLDNACLLESQVFGLCFSTDDQKEGMGAFLEKRPPAFKSR